jgi:hypothetical protein
LNDLKPLESLPTQWQVKSFAAAGVTAFQLDPEAGLLPDTIIEAGDQQYRIVKADKDLVTIDRPLVNGLSEGSVVTKVTTFSPFDGRTYNQQQHAIYLGDPDLLNLEAEATIEVVGASALRDGFVWEYFGKLADDKLADADEEKWRPLTVEKDKQIDGAASVVLTKPKGEIAEVEIGGKKSRWIRAFAKKVERDAKPINVEDFKLRINSLVCSDKLTVCPPASPVESPKAEAMANSTPLVLDNVFLPLGREPRQFDAFYLASAEAFSKKDAQVRICFELADPTFQSLAAVRLGRKFGNKVLAGVGRDHALHLFQFAPGDGTVTRLPDRDALRPPIPGDGGEPPASTKPIGLNPQCKPVTRSLNEDFFVDVAAGGTIWTWHESATTPNSSGWKAHFGSLPIPPETARIDDIVPVNLPGVKVVFANCQLWVGREVNNVTEWELKPTQDTAGQPNPVKLAALTPIWQDTGGGLDGLTAASDMIGVSDNNRLYRVTTGGTCTDLSLKFDPIDPTKKAKVHAGHPVEWSDCKVGAIRPAAYSKAGKLAVVTANEDLTKLVLYRDSVAPPARLIDLPQGDKISGATVEMAFVNGAPQFSVLCETAAGSTYVASWQPFDGGNVVKDILFKSVYSGSGSLGGAPVALQTHVVAPGKRGDLFVAQFDSTNRFELTTPNAAAKDGLVVTGTANLFVPHDEFSARTPSGRITREVSETGLNLPPDQDVLYEVKSVFGPVLEDPELLGYRRHVVKFRGATQAAAKKMDLDKNDNETVEGDFLIIDDTNSVDIYQVTEITGNNPRRAKLSTALSTNVLTKYWTPEKLANGRVAPIIELGTASGTWNASILDHARLYFSATVDPPLQHAKAFKVDSVTHHPVTMALQKPWRSLVGTPGANAPYVIDATLHEWQQKLADTSSNPELSWEYSTGTAWESLVLEEEGTLNFKNTGAIRFRVPDNLAPVDWSGKTNHWIRARLIGGDYGHEEVTVEIDTSDSKKSKQVIHRSTEGIRPPVVVKLHISYGFCDGVLPIFVLAEDSGTVRDQSDANRTKGALVETFVPLALTLGRLTKPVVSTDETKPAAECPPDCDCKTLHPNKALPPAGEAATVPSESERIRGREVYIGLAATPSEAPVNVLLLVEEQKHTEFAPMTIEALVADRFVPIVVDDATRALGESGVLSMSFAVPPTSSELFGKDNLTWLRLIPKSKATNDWVPTLRGAYLNAAWASATETLTRELLGSSDGAPNLTVHLARPPVLRDTLELRVKEPLGEEERAALLKLDAKSVLSAVEGLPGDWVLWKQVTDPDDELATARVYALDEASGEIRFGDGRHGKIPPIGRDSIVAFSYSRTEPDPTGGDSVPGNAIEARTVLNLVSPVETVESVTVADQAAGGAPPESDERVLRFGFARLRHRSRAVTAEDLEDLALQSSPDIVQARAFVRRGYIRLVIVMRGKNPGPTAAQIRELRQLLLEAAPVSLSAPNALQIEGPRIRRLRIELGLLVEALDHAGELSAFVKEKLAEFFDTGTGGLDKDGWALGAKPSEEDVALAISDAPYLESIETVKLYEITEDGKELPSLEGPGSREIVMLADDPFRIQFETAEVMV